MINTIQSQHALIDFLVITGEANNRRRNDRNNNRKNNRRTTEEFQHRDENEIIKS
jgi:hypothetical protein